jgi:protein-tyrosine phosphatase
MRILMVCLGNICRSPIAEGVLRHKAAVAGLAWTINSAGTDRYHIGKPPHKHSINICKVNGIDIREQIARPFLPGDLDSYDMIYAMATDVIQEIKRIGGPEGDYSRVRLFMNELLPGTDTSVPDPWYGDESGYLDVYKMIDECCDAIIEKYKEQDI